MLKTKLNTLQQKPKQKFNYCMTSAQEIGWDMDTDMHQYNTRFGVAKKMYDETRYAENFITFQSRSPFA